MLFTHAILNESEAPLPAHASGSVPYRRLAAAIIIRAIEDANLPSEAIDERARQTALMFLFSPRSHIASLCDYLDIEYSALREQLLADGYNSKYRRLRVRALHYLAATKRLTH